MKKSTTVLTLQKLISRRAKEKGLSRSGLVQAIGYINVSKGIRRLDTYLQTLESPGDDFINNLLSVLNIDTVSFCRSLSASLDKINSEANKRAREDFQPYIEVLIGIQIRGAIVWQAVHNMCRLSVSEDLQGKPYREEFDTVIALYQDHVENILHDNLKRSVTGFHYHRAHDHYLKFNTDLILTKIVYVQPSPMIKLSLENRVANLLSGGVA